MAGCVALTARSPSIGQSADVQGELSGAVLNASTHRASHECAALMCSAPEDAPDTAATLAPPGANAGGPDAGMDCAEAACIGPTTRRCSSLAPARAGNPIRAPHPRGPARAPAGGSPTPTGLCSSGCSPTARPTARRTSLRTVVRPAPLSAFLCVCAYVSPGCSRCFLSLCAPSC